VAVLPDGRVVSGGDDGRVRVWDPAAPGAVPVELGGHDGNVRAVAVLPDGRVVSGGDDGQMRVWDVARVSEIARAACSVTAIAVAHGPATDERLLVAHEGQGVTMWSVCISTNEYPVPG
jgi:WD40 repeat protein